ncbi:MAG: LamG domain-containing protein, partial [Calditrichaeota bacterium]|nr:LamG domain-containing protein [Calditrichota bacterium]
MQTLAKYFVFSVIAAMILMPRLSYCQNSYALSFDGGNDYFSLDHRAMHDLTDCTVEYWIYIERDGQDQAASTISGASSDAGNNEYLHYFQFAVGLRPHIKNQAPGEGPEIPVDEWFHIAITRNEDGQWTAYFNGEEVGSGDLPGGALTIARNGLVFGQDQDVVGGNFDVTQALLGRVDELRIW